MKTWRRGLLAPLAAAVLLGCGAGGKGGDGGEAGADSTAADSTAADSTAADSALAAADSAAADSARKAPEAVPVETAPAAVDDISSYLLFSSTVETEAAVEVHPQVSGLVVAVRAEEGDHVARGDTLVRLDDNQARIDAAESEVNYRHLESNFGRTDEMFRRKLISTQEYENAKYQLDQARLGRDKTRLVLEYTAITAPFSGVLTNRYVQVGGRVGPGDKLFDLVKLDDMIARVFVPGRYLTAVRTGQEAVVESDFLPGMNFAGHVRRISPVVDPKSGTFKVTVGLEDRWEHLRPGIFVNVQIITDTHRGAILVPKEAIVYDGGDKYVFVVEDSAAVKVRLDAGFENSRFVEARSLIDAGTPVIVVGQSGLKDRARVKVVRAAGDADAPDAAASPG
ncbi:MAG: efflux RND transporter periplasmic adaptor subunit [Gemmatimonadota bacterium]